MATKLAILGGPPVRSRQFPIWPRVQERDVAGLQSVLESGAWGRKHGDRVATFEHEFARYQQARFGIAVMNGTVALRLALLAAGVAAGDEVIVPPYTFFSTASAVVEANCVPVFADIDADTYCLSPAALKTAVTDKTRAIIPVHFGGHAAAMSTISEVAQQKDLVVIEDAAQAHGAEYLGQRVGALGQMGCFSFQSSKNLSSGEGGMILTNEVQYERICRSLHTCGRYPEGEWYDHFLLGGNYRMTEFQGALLLSQMTRLEDQTQRREQNGGYLTQRLAELPGINPLSRAVEVTRHAYHLFIFRYEAAEFDGLSKASFLQALSAEGIPCSGGYKIPLYRQPVFTQPALGPFSAAQSAYAQAGYGEVNCPAAELACEQACWLPQSVLLGDRNDMQDIINAIDKIYKNREALLC